MSLEPIGVGIIGASGYSGAELMRYIAVHPHLKLEWATANREAGRSIPEVFPNLRGFVDAPFLTLDEARPRLGEVRAVFLSLPHGESPSVLPALMGEAPGPVWIDLAGDFRTPDPDGYQRYYGREHAAPEILDSFVYGFTEAARPALRNARRIANPGCFATGILLALHPLAVSGALPDVVCLTGVTGSSGSGRDPGRTTHHPERASNLRAYKPLVHQHLLEAEWFLGRARPHPVRLQFVPQSAPLVRGIFTTVFLPGRDPNEIRQIYETVYAGEALIDVMEGSPDLRWVQGTPRSVVGVDGDRDRGAVVFTAIDNLGKGAAGQAIQNLNCALGVCETAGLNWPGGFV